MISDEEEENFISNRHCPPIPCDIMGARSSEDNKVNLDPMNGSIDLSHVDFSNKPNPLDEKVWPIIHVPFIKQFLIVFIFISLLLFIDFLFLSFDYLFSCFL